MEAYGHRGDLAVTTGVDTADLAAQEGVPFFPVTLVSSQSCTLCQR